MSTASGPDHVTLIDQDGIERTFVVHDAIDVDGHWYYLVEDASDPEQVALLKEQEGTLEPIGGEEFDRVLSLLEAEEQ
jgi:hypothetical protein